MKQEKNAFLHIIPQHIEAQMPMEAEEKTDTLYIRKGVLRNLESFKECIKMVLELEGGYFNHPNDAGGETKYGITKRDYPELDIPRLTKQQATVIYLLHYWDPMGVEKLMPPLHLVVFDAGVNCGIRTAVKMLQELAGVEKDGIIGPKTIAAAQHITPQQYLQRRELYYRRIVKTNPSQKVFLKGWLNRLQVLKRNI